VSEQNNELCHRRHLSFSFISVQNVDLSTKHADRLLRGHCVSNRQLSVRGGNINMESVSQRKHTLQGWAKGDKTEAVNKALSHLNFRPVLQKGDLRSCRPLLDARTENRTPLCR
jgi:hypothetical protein